MDKKLSLKNNGDLEIFFLGTGAALASRNYQTNMLIIKGNDHVLVDFGQTGKIALETVAGLKLTDIENVLPTHSHADHIGGIESLAIASRYVGLPAGRPKTKLIAVPEFSRTLWETSLRGGLEWNEFEPEKINPETGKPVSLSLTDYFDLSIQPRPIKGTKMMTYEVNVGDIHIEMFRTVHIPSQSAQTKTSVWSFGLMIDDKVFYSGDTKFDHDLIERYYDRSVVMFHDCQLFTGGVHASLDELITLPQHIREKIVIMHYGDEFDTPENDAKIRLLGDRAIQGEIYNFGASIAKVA